MKKFYLPVAVCTLFLTGCAGMTMEEMRMEEKQMKMMEDMQTQMNEMQFQVNSAETAATRAKEMANEAMIKAAQSERAMKMMKGRKKHRMMK